jgi:Sigma-70 region 3
MAFNDKEHGDKNIKPESFSQRVLASRQSAPSWMLTALKVDRAIETLSSTLGRVPAEVEIAEALQISIADYRNALCDLENVANDDFHADEAEADAAEEKRAMAEEMKHWAPTEGWPQFDRPPEPEVSADWLPLGALRPRPPTAGPFPHPR